MILIFDKFGKKLGEFFLEEETDYLKIFWYYLYLSWTTECYSSFRTQTDQSLLKNIYRLKLKYLQEGEKKSYLNKKVWVSYYMIR